MNKQPATLRPFHSWVIACHHAVRCLVVLGGLLFPCHYVVAGDWPQWRGPQRDGRIVEFELARCLAETVAWGVASGGGRRLLLARRRRGAGRRSLPPVSMSEHVRCIATRKRGRCLARSLPGERGRAPGRGCARPRPEIHSGRRQRPGLHARHRKHLDVLRPQVRASSLAARTTAGSSLSRPLRAGLRCHRCWWTGCASFTSAWTARAS